MKRSMWGWFKKLFSNYSKKTVHLYRIFLFKIDVYLFNRKKNKYFKQIGKIFYTELLNGKESEQILEIIQPIFSNIDKIDRKIENLLTKIDNIAKKEKISKEEVERIDRFIVDTDKKLSDSIFNDNDDLDDISIDEDDLGNAVADYPSENINDEVINNDDNHKNEKIANGKKINKKNKKKSVKKEKMIKQNSNE